MMSLIKDVDLGWDHSASVSRSNSVTQTRSKHSQTQVHDSAKNVVVDGRPVGTCDPCKDGSTLGQWMAKASAEEERIFALYSPATEGFVYHVDSSRSGCWLETFVSRADAEIEAGQVEPCEGVHFPWVEAMELSHRQALQICLDVPITPQLKEPVLGYWVGTIAYLDGIARYEVHLEVGVDGTVKRHQPSRR